MGTPYSTQAIRHENYIDVYLTQPDKAIWHYFANPNTQWRYGKQLLDQNAATTATVVRQAESIDAYYINDKNELIHYFIGNRTHWKHECEILDKNVTIKNPACVRFKSHIDLYYWNQSGELVHRYASQETSWKHTEPFVLAKGGGESLCALRNSQWVIDVYYEKDNMLHHISNGNWTDWKHTQPNIYSTFPRVKSGSPIRAIRNGESIDVFYLAQDNKICQIICNPRTKNQHKFIRHVDGPGPSQNDLSVVVNGPHIDLYYIRDNRVYHTYSGLWNFWFWKTPHAISDDDAKSGLCALRTKFLAIDVFYVNKNGILRNLFIGEGNNHNWFNYTYGNSQIFEVPRFVKQQQQKKAQKNDKAFMKEEYKKNHKDEKSVPEFLICPVSMQKMIEPVLVTVCGHTFQKLIIQEWVKKRQSCPLCNQPIEDPAKMLVKNHALMDAILQYQK